MTAPAQAPGDRAACAPEYPGWRGLTAEVLRAAADRAGIDFATVLLHDRLVRSAEHGPFIRRVAASAEATPPPGALLAIAPGAAYREYPQTGADGRRLADHARHLGWAVAVIPVASFGRLADNARTIAAWLRGRPERTIVLVSLSKGSADVRTALARPDTGAAFRHVAAWVSLSGIVHGSALADWFLDRPLWRAVARLVCWRHGYPFAALDELRRGPGGPLAAPLVVPAGLRVVHVVGVPLQGHLRSRRARRGHRRVAPLGPNDGGGIVLGDLHRLPGWIYPVLGADHYLQPADDLRPLVGRILCAALEADPAAEPAATGCAVEDVP